MYIIRIKTKKIKFFWVANNHTYSEGRRQAFVFESVKAAMSHIADSTSQNEYEIVRKHECFLGRFTYLDRDKHERKGFVGTVRMVDNKEDARVFNSKMELLAYKDQVNIPKDVIKFETISNIGDITKSEIGGGFWLRTLIANINDCVTYTNEKADLEKIKRIAATAQNSVNELQENMYLVDNLFTNDNI